MQLDPALVQEILALRAYARAVETVDRAQSDEDLDALPRSWVDRVFAVQALRRPQVG